MRSNLIFFGGLILIAWILETIDQFTGGVLEIDYLGIRPREFSGLLGIPLMPFLHGNWSHLLNNTISIVMLAPIAMILDEKNFKEVTVFIVVMSGLAIWVFARDSYHIGMSALIFGYFGYILAMCFFNRNWLLIPIGLIILYTQSNMFSSMIPFLTPHKISWEGHLFGAIAGGCIGYISCKMTKHS